MLYELLQILLTWIGVVVLFFVEGTVSAGIRPDPALLIVMLLVITVWLWSACWASSIAGMRRRSEHLHFFLGLLFPVVYPLIILFALDVKMPPRMIEELVAKHGAGADAATGEPPAPDGAAPPLPDGTAAYDAAYFKGIARDEAGEYTGPWLIQFGNSEVTALRIVDVLPNAVSIEIEGRDGAMQKIRIPYSKITGCTKR